MYKRQDIIIKRGKEVWIYSFPFCLVVGYEKWVAELGKSDSILTAPDFTISIQEHRHKDRIKGKNCKLCRYNSVCLGVWKKYVNLFGFEEFRPVKSTHMPQKYS